MIISGTLTKVVSGDWDWCVWWSVCLTVPWIILSLFGVWMRCRRYLNVL